MGSFFIVILISTIVNKSEILPPFYFAARVICLIVLIDYCSKKGGLLYLLTLMKRLIGFYILITLFFQIFNQDYFGKTMSGNNFNFLAPDNDLGYWYVVFIMLVYITSYCKSYMTKKRELIFWGTVCFVSLCRAWAGAGLVGYTLFILILFLNRTRFVKLFTPLNALAFNIVISASIILLKIQYLFKWLIVDVLNKSLTISNRIYVWNATISNIMKKPYLGYGTNLFGKLSINFVPEFGRYYFSHNIFLEIMIQGGIIAFIIFILLYFYADKVFKEMNKIYDLKAVVAITIFSLLFMQSTEFCLYKPITNIPLILCFYFNNILHEIEMKKNLNIRG